MSIKLIAGKENHLVRDIEIKTNFQEHIVILNSFNMIWTKNVDGTARQSIDWVYYFFNTKKLTTDTDLHNFKGEKIESFRYLAYYLEKDKKKKSVYVNISIFSKLNNQEKKHAVMIKIDDKRIRFSPVNGTRFFVPFHLHMRTDRKKRKNKKKQAGAFEICIGENFQIIKTTKLF